jgi:sugar phosphate isomerase/epimerase
MLSRREFAGLALAGLPLVKGLAAIDSTFGGIQFGAISTSFRGMSVDGLIQAMTEVGLGQMELFSPTIEPSSGAPVGGPGGREAAIARAANPEVRAGLRKWRLSVSMDEIRPIRKKFDDAGILLRYFCINMNDTFTEEEIDAAFRMAQTLGVEAISSAATLTSAQRIVPIAEKHKLMVSMHNFANATNPNEICTPESFAKVLAMSRYFAANFDIGHYTAAGFDAVEFIKENHARITHIHIKDRKNAKNGGQYAPFGEGDAPIKEVLTLMKREKYPFPAFLEVEYNPVVSDSIADVKKSLQYCKSALS